DRFNWTNEDKYNNDFYILADNGRYNKQTARGHEWNTDAFLNYKRIFSQDWSLDVTAGGNIRINEFSGTNVGIGRDSPLNVPNLFAIGNFATISANEEFDKKEVQSLFGFATIGWKDAIFLDVTARNDWSSTLKPDNWSFFYPSVGLTAVVNDLVPFPDWWTFAKVRGSWAQVGNDTDPYQVSRAANILGGGNGGFLQLSTTVPAETLLPEETTATEIGFDTRFFQDRLGLDFTWYKSNSTDQLFRQSIPTPSGAESVFINGADIENTGFELTLSATPIQSGDFTWDLFFNYGTNNSTVIKLAEGLDQLNIGGASFLRQFRLIAGEPWGDVYSRGFERVDAPDPSDPDHANHGAVIIEANGTPRTTSGLDVQVANFNPDWLGGFGNTFTWRNLSLSFLIDIRQGGSIVSNTNAIMFADG
ncbi:MAG: SusC/RagA family TonB-linked outer membrane protein, partial [Cyclobacteriaceae bacterium]|nr:SusC/RagA family TonB-linked outer membrane protein [Cyclobacteriaceae bacterium]